MLLPRDARTYDDLVARFRWQVPARYNIGYEVCGRHAQDRGRFALYFEDESGATAAFTYWDLQVRANALSNALAALGVQRGDRVAILLPQRPETAIAHVACYQMGAIARRCRTCSDPMRSSIAWRMPAPRWRSWIRTRCPNCGP